MKRSITFLTLLILIVVSYGLYNLKYEVEDLQDQANAYKAQMEEDRRAIKVLQAEWAYLTRPDRLQRLSGKFLSLEPTVAKQVGGVADLRLKTIDGLEAAEPVIDTSDATLPAAPSAQANQLPVSNTGPALGASR
ncbi:hypothetical protein [Iodidimonas sp. SYSU 1G8]|uniref:cell division protein FtsL n=1 Tax=Iodidimonas sp. SYSU 1G8 TaxID=3133967 RepID=UPI0031FF33BF